MADFRDDCKFLLLWSQYRDAFKAAMLQLGHFDPDRPAPARCPIVVHWLAHDGSPSSLDRSLRRFRMAFAQAV
jgi:hypothetical protein